MKHSSSLGNSRGITRLGILVLALLILIGTFLGSQIFPFYYYFYDIQGQMEAQAAKATVNSDKQIRQYLLKKIKQYEIPIPSEDHLKINRLNNKIVISMSYTEILYLDLSDIDEEWNWDLWEFRFEPHAEGRL